MPPALFGSRVDIDFAWEGLFCHDARRSAVCRTRLPTTRSTVRAQIRRNGMTFGFLAAPFLLKWYRGKRTDVTRCRYFVMVPQAIRSPALPAGSVFISSALA